MSYVIAAPEMLATAAATWRDRFGDTSGQRVRCGSNDRTAGRGRR